MVDIDVDINQYIYEREYNEFVSQKQTLDFRRGIPYRKKPEHDQLFDFQQAILKWAVEQGRAAIFADCGLGKTPMQLMWADYQVGVRDGCALIVCPLAVAKQTLREACKFGVRANIATSQDDALPVGINITNYEKLHKFDPAKYDAIVLDESSILKAFSGVRRRQIQEFACKIPYRLACTATPSPNDIVELGTHAEFCGVMKNAEMRAKFFVNDTSHPDKWRLKGHAKDEFYRWLSQWSVAIRKPSDLGFYDRKFVLPPLNIHHHIVDSRPPVGELFVRPAQTLAEQRQAKRRSLSDRVAKVAEIANTTNDQVLIWVSQNDESDAIRQDVIGCVEIKGADSDDHKTNSMMDFAAGKIRALVTKPSIAGFGMNWQQCHTMIFTGITHSFEQYYQAVRRCWRFGQKRPVDAHLVYSENEGAVIENLERKEAEMAATFDGVISEMGQSALGKGSEREQYNPTKAMTLPDWI